MPLSHLGNVAETFAATEGKVGTWPHKLQLLLCSVRVGVPGSVVLAWVLWHVLLIVIGVAPVLSLLSLGAILGIVDLPT